MQTGGMADEAVGDAYARARKLCRGAGESPQLFSILFGLYIYYLARCELHTARELSEQRLEIAEQGDNDEFLMLAHSTAAPPLFYLGDGDGAQKHLEASLALYDSDDLSDTRAHDDLDSGVSCLAYSAWNLWLRGYPDRARAMNDEALLLAQRLGRPYCRGIALAFSVGFRHLNRDPEGALEECRELLRLAHERGFNQWLATGAMVKGWALAELGEPNKGAEMLAKTLAAYRAHGASLSASYWLSLLAEIHHRAEQFEQGLEVIDEAIQVVEKNDERYYEAELYRLRGELLRGTALHLEPTSTELAGAEANAASAFEQALHIARRQSQTLLELRAAHSLGLLWHQQKKTNEAVSLVEPILAHFSEELEALDLREVRDDLAAWRAVQ